MYFTSHFFKPEIKLCIRILLIFIIPKVSATQTEENNQLTLDSSLVKLEEWEADLARTLTDQHDANILVAEQRERDLMRQLREVEEETSAESDTCVSYRLILVV